MISVSGAEPAAIHRHFSAERSGCQQPIFDQQAIKSTHYNNAQTELIRHTGQYARSATCDRRFPPVRTLGSIHTSYLNNEIMR
jgi:hypothetical protein